MDRFTNDILKEIREKSLIKTGDRVTVGFSGGADSVCLLNVLSELKKMLKIEITAVHVNHGIRGGEALRDENFCREEAKRLGVCFISKHVDVPAYVNETGMSEEEAGRILRYKALRETEHDVICVAHHADDQAETVLFNILRGSALKGIGGINQKRDDIVRPLLHKGKTEILEYIKRNGLNFVTDSTNLSNDHTRNYLRNEIIPQLNKNVNKRASEHIVKMADHIREADEYLSIEAGRISDEVAVIEKTENIVTANIDRKRLKEKPQIIRRYVIINILEKMDVRLKDWTEKHFLDVDTAITGVKGHHVDLPDNVAAENTSKFTELKNVKYGD